MGEVAKDGDGIVGGGGRCLEALAVDRVEASRVDLAQVPERVGHVVADVVDYTLNRPAVEQVAVGVGELGFEDLPHTPARDRIGKRKREYEDDSSEQITDSRSVDDVADE